MPAPHKKISAKEKEFAHLIVNGNSPVESARKAFGWKCESYSKESVKAYNLAKTLRIKHEIEKLRAHQEKESKAAHVVVAGDRIDWEQIRKFAFTRLEEIRDNPNAKGQSRYNAIKALEKLADPTTDINLIWRWIDVVWRGLETHCPKCHGSFPIWKIENNRLDDWRVTTDRVHTPPEEEDVFTRRMELLTMAEKRKRPHPGQVMALSAPERHLVGRGAARAGKSFLLAMLAYLGFMIPGVEIWVLARIYEDARSEVEYLRGFIKTLFYPLDKFIIKERIDKATGEMVLTSKWGSELKIKSGKSKGSLTGRELEFCLVAEPAWVPDELYEEVRARMSSRLGRILAFGTPKGYGGFLGRMINITGRDPATGKILRLKPEDRLIENGAKWAQSMLVYPMDPAQNPEYVKAELDAARMELTDAEYAAEFMGEMTAEQGAKFPQVKEHMMRRVTRDEYEKCSFVQGVDQGPKNFGAVMAATDGTTAFIVREFFDSSNTTIKANLLKLRKTGPQIVKHVGGHGEYYNLTIFDLNPQIGGILEEMDKENCPWPSPYTYRHTNQGPSDNWRQETTLWINQMAQSGRLVFDEDCDQLFWQVLDCLHKPGNTEREDNSKSDKGWIVRDPWRGDHVLDAWLLAMWTLSQNMIELPPDQYEVKKGWDDHQAAWKYRLRRDEARELAGYTGSNTKEDEIFEDSFGRPRKSRSFLPNPGYYQDY